MLSLFILCAVSCCFATVHCNGDIGPGEWEVTYIGKCDETTHRFKFDISREKINRTHDGFKAKLQLDEDFTDMFGIRIDICKYVDGGCKAYQVMTDDSVPNFINKYAENNARACLEMANIDPPEFPIPAGEYDIVDYIFDYSELPAEGPYGDYGAEVKLLRGPEVVGALDLEVTFKEKQDDDK